MAVAFDAVGPSSAGAGNTSSSSLSWTHPSGAVSNRAILVACSLDQSPDTSTMTVTCAGVTMTSLALVHANSGTGGYLQVWGLTGVGTGTLAIVVTVTGGAPSDLEGGSLSFSGTASFGTAVTNAGSSNTASVVHSSNTNGNLIAGFAAAGDIFNSATSPSTSRFIINEVAGAGNATGNAAGATSPATGTSVTMAWSNNTAPFAAIAIEAQPPPPAAPGPVPLPLLPPGWFPGADAVTADPGGIPFAPLPGTTDATPASTAATPFPEAAAFKAPPLPPGWFPGSAAVTQDPGGIPFYSEPEPADPSKSVLPPPAPDNIGIADWLPLPPGYFPGSQAVAVDPGGIPFYSQPLPLTPPPAPPPPPVITGQTGTGLGAYFHDQNGSPRLYFGAETWGLPGNAGRWNGGNWRGDYDFYHATRAAQGYTANVTHPWGHTHTGCNNDLGHTWDGIFPFLVNGTAADLTGQAGTITLNDPFWQRIDYMLQSAAGVGITVFLDMSMSNDMPTGAGHGFTNGVFQNASTSQIQAASTAVAARYAATPNLVWFFGDDYYNDDDTNFNAMWTGINAADPRIASCTSIEYYPTGNTARYDLSGPPGGETPHGWGNTHAAYNFVYCYMQTYFGIEYAYTEPAPIGPVIWGDGMFWGNAGTSAQNDQVQRNDVWWSLASGARGIVAENENVLQWSSTAAASLTGDGLFPSWAKNIYTLFSSLPGWYRLIPDTGNALVTAGRGTRAVYSASEYLANTDNYVAASYVSDGSLAVIYCAQAMSITIDQTKMAAGYTATWADPASGALTGTATGSTYSSSGLGNNSAGGTDWVLILQGTPAAAVPGAGLPEYLPLPPGWFPGADRVTAIPGGIPFTQVPPPTDQNAPAAAPVVTVNAGLATGTGTAQQPVIAIGANDTAGPALGTGTAQSPLPAVAVNDLLATGTGTAQQPVIAIGANDTLATGTGTAQSPVAAIAVNEVLATGTGTAQSPLPATGANDLLATGTGTAQSPLPAIGANDTAGPALGTGTALQPATSTVTPAPPAPPYPANLLAPGWFPGADAVTTQPDGIPFLPQPAPADPGAFLTTSGQANAQLATGTGAALSPLAAIGANDTAGPAPGTGTSQAPLPAAAANASVATGTGTAQPPVPAIAVNAGLATGTGTAQSPLPAAGVSDALATGAGAAQGDDTNASFTPAVTVNAGLATGTGTALQAATTLPAPSSTFVPVPAVPLWFPGADAVITEPGGIPFYVQPLPIGEPGAVILPVTPTAAVATAAGTALQPLAAVTVTAGLASGTGAALQPLAAVTVTAGLASGTGAALQPALTLTSNATAQVATAAGVALQPVALAAAAVIKGYSTATSVSEAAGMQATVGEAAAMSATVTRQASSQGSVQ